MEPDIYDNRRAMKAFAREDLDDFLDFVVKEDIGILRDYCREHSMEFEDYCDIYY